MRKLLIAAGLALATLAAAPANAAAPRIIPEAQTLDRLPVEYARHTREHRMWEIQRNMERQQRRDHYRHGRGYDRRPGYGPRHGGPPPWAPAHGYRRHHRY